MPSFYMLKIQKKDACWQQYLASVFIAHQASFYYGHPLNYFKPNASFTLST